MYFVNGIVPELRDENGKPNSKFLLKMRMIKLLDIEDAVIKMFDDEAAPNLFFHNSQMVKNISNQTELLSRAENLADEEFLRVKLAALFLFTGFISDSEYDSYAESSVRMVEEILTGHGFERKDIEEIQRLVRNSCGDVRESRSDDILHDARYDYLGRVDYIMLTDKLLKEQAEYGKIYTREEWLEIQLKLLADHEFRTEKARILRSVSLEDQADVLGDFYSPAGLLR